MPLVNSFNNHNKIFMVGVCVLLIGLKRSKYRYLLSRLAARTIVGPKIGGLVCCYDGGDCPLVRKRDYKHYMFYGLQLL